MMNAVETIAILFVVGVNLAFSNPSANVSAAQSKPGDWIKTPKPVWTGTRGLAADPAVVAVRGGYRMYFTSLASDGAHTVIATADSVDGIKWESSNQELISPHVGMWDENLETCGVLQIESHQIVLFTGYRDVGKPAKGFPASLGLARFDDGRVFSVQEKPELEPTSGGFDNDAIYHPSVLKVGSSWMMAYTGHAYTNDPATGPIGVRVLMATSSDGIQWTKVKLPLLSADPRLSWTADGVAEPCLLNGPDGKFYLLFTGLKGEQRVIGIAQADSPAGPWTISPQPILQPTPGSFDSHQMLAPSVMIEADRVRMWYTAVDDDGRMSVGYAQSHWPIWPSH